VFAMGGIGTKVDGRRGWPDVTAVLPGGRVLFIEVKQPGGRVSKIQQRTIDIMEGLGAEVHVVRSLEGFNALL